MNFDEILDLFLSLHPHLSDHQPHQVLFAFKTWYYHWDGKMPEKIEYKEQQLELF